MAYTVAGLIFFCLVHFWDMYNIGFDSSTSFHDCTVRACALLNILVPLQMCERNVVKTMDIQSVEHHSRLWPAIQNGICLPKIEPDLISRLKPAFSTLEKRI